MQTVTTTSKQFTLNVSDFWKGLIMAVGGAVFQVILDTINSGSLTFDWPAIGKTALGAIIVYLSKNFFTPSKIVVSDAPKGTVEAVKEGNAEVTVTPT
jgi:hypothetical protein